MDKDPITRGQHNKKKAPASESEENTAGEYRQVVKHKEAMRSSN